MMRCLLLWMYSLAFATFVLGQPASAGDYDFKSSTGKSKDLTGKMFEGNKIDSFGTKSISTITQRGNYTFLTVNFGNIARGTHAREFNVPRGTHLVLGQVQEGINAGDARYSTLGIAVRAESTGDWRCRVIWRMEWSQGDRLPTYGRFILIRD